MMARLRPSSREFLWLSIGNQATALSGLLLMLVLARSVSITEVGRVVFAQAIAGVILTLVDVRFEDAIQRYYPLIARSSTVAVANSFFWRVCRFDVGLGIAVIVMSVGAWLLDALPRYGIWVPTYELLALVTAGVGTVLGSLNGGYAVAGRLSELGRITVATTVLNGAMAIIGLLLADGHGYLIGQLLGSCCQVLACWWGIRTQLPRDSRREKRPLPTGFNRFLAKSSAASSLALGSDAGVLGLAGMLGSPVLVAYLKVAQAPGRVVSSAFSPISVQAFPRIAAMAANGDRAGVRDLTRRITRAALVIAALIVALAIPLMSPVLGFMYGQEFQPVWGAAVLLVLATCIRAAVAWSKVLPLAIGRPGLRLLVLGLESALLLMGVVLAATRADESQGALFFGLAAGLVAAMLAAFWLVYVQRMRLAPAP